MALKILLNYRRGDTAGNAGHLYATLAKHFGSDNVFMDIDKIEPGLNFVEVIKQWVGRCDVFIAMIGAQWLTSAYDSGERRLDDPNDFVRMEIEAGLARPDVRVIPVTVQDVEMPAAEQMPESMRELAYRNGLEIRDVSWDYDVQRLIKAIERIGGGGKEPTPRLNRRLLAIVAAAVLLAIAAIGGVLLFRDGDDPDPQENGGAQESVPTQGDERTIAAGSLLFAADGQLLAVTGREAKPLANSSNDHEPDWSREGDQLAIARDGDIVVLDAAGKDVRSLTSGAQDNAPSWSPNGSQIAFDRPLPNGRYHLWIVDMKGEERSFPNDDTRTGGQPDWSPDGKRIVFQRVNRLYVVEVESEEEDPLSIGVTGSAREPSWSPTRDEIAFALVGGENPGIYVYSLEDGTARPVSIGLTNARYPGWSSNGERIAFVTSKGIWSVNRDGNGQRPVYINKELKRLEAPSWRPNDS